MDTRRIGSYLALATWAVCTPISTPAASPGDRIEGSPSPIVRPSDDPPGRPADAVPALSAGPWVSGRISTPVRTRLESSFSVAAHRIGTAPECQALFADLGADGLEMLSLTLYFPASLKLEKQLCSRAFGWTTVGGAPTFLCRRFSKLSDTRAATVLIHEALHHAGMGEWPSDPAGLTPAAIDDLVEQACGL